MLGVGTYVPAVLCAELEASSASNLDVSLRSSEWMAENVHAAKEYRKSSDICTSLMLM